MPDSIAITISATTMEGTPAQDPQLDVEIIELTPTNQTVSRQVVHNFNGRVVLTVPAPDGFPTWQVRVTFSRFDTVSGFLFQPRGDPTPAYTMQLMRLPSAWKPDFTPLQLLSATRFQPLRDVVSVSTSVDLKHGPPVGDLNARYDSLSDPAQIQGKMAMLNLFSVLVDEIDPVDDVPWFTHVREIVRIDQERFVAEVDGALFENVQTILSGLSGKFRGQGFFTEPDADLLLHVGNIPPRYGMNPSIDKMITLKKNYEQGDLQLTMSFLNLSDRAVHLLDCDLDENRNIVLHSLDLVKHLFNGGTSPISMHEYIVEHSAQSAGGIASVDLGYRLV